VPEEVVTPEEVVEKPEVQSTEEVTLPKGEEDWSEDGKMPEWASRRFRESSEKTQETQRQLEESRQQLAEFAAHRDHLQRQVQGLTGASPPSKDDAEIAEVVKILDRASPGFSKHREVSADLEKRIEDMERRHWRGYANTAIEGIYSRTKKALSVEELPRQSQQVLEWSFQGFVNSSDKNKDRYEHNDPTLFDEFLLRGKYYERRVEPLQLMQPPCRWSG